MALITVNLLFVRRKREKVKKILFLNTHGFMAGLLHSHLMSCIVGGKMFNHGNNGRRMERGANEACCEEAC